jgi:lysophospholipase L1-like esterase
MLLGRIRRDAPATRIFVAQIVGSRNPSQQRRIASYNADVARIVAAYRDPLLYLVNLGAVRAPHVHPNDAGYAAMANLWFAAVARVEDEPRSGQPWIGL